MIVVISYIKLKTPFHFFKLSRYALSINFQIKSSNCVKFKKHGFWLHHYTMTLWSNESEMKTFSSSGAHLKAMKISANIAKDIKTISIKANELPSWKEAKQLLKKAKVLTYA